MLTSFLVFRIEVLERSRGTVVEVGGHIGFFIGFAPDELPYVRVFPRGQVRRCFVRYPFGRESFRGRRQRVEALCVVSQPEEEL